jgi:poly-gamma-glutamate synthesis protein (capsule biosynthesis protein)
MTLLFVGDVMLARGVAFYTEREGGGDYQFPFAHASSTLRGADLTVGNLEHPVSDRGRNQGSKYSLRAKPQSIAGLADAGFDVVSLANNHIWDWGTDALTDTLAQLDAAGIRHVGAGMNEAEANQPYTVEINGNSLVFVAWTDLYPEGLEAKGHESGISRFREAEAVETVRALAATYDVVVVLFHWGGEYQTSANEKQRRIARVLADAGADLVVGHHPHVVQETEQYRGGRIAYSLGNFIFDQGFSEETLRGLALRVTVTGKTITRVEELPTRMNRYFQPVFETL